MSGFSVEWLQMREPYDHAARSQALVAALAAVLPADRPLSLLELAVGFGSGPRFVAPRLPGPQRWTVVDHDPVLLEALAASVGEGPLSAHDVTTVELDLRQLENLEVSAHAVFTQALLDLVSHEWLTALADWLAARRVPFLGALSVDGRVTWRPGHPIDDEVHAAFRAHQLWDRGFGASPGYRAAPLLAAMLGARGFTVTLDRADWEIPEINRTMLSEMARGIAGAATEAAEEGGTTPARVAAWLDDRLSAIEDHEVSLTVGHLDLLALP